MPTLIGWLFLCMTNILKCYTIKTRGTCNNMYKRILIVLIFVLAVGISGWLVYADTNENDKNDKQSKPDNEDVITDIITIEHGFYFSENEYDEMIKSNMKASRNFEEDLKINDASTWINFTHSWVDTSLIFLQQNNFNIDSEEYKSHKEAFIKSKAPLLIAILEGDHFDSQFQKHLLKEAIKYMEGYALGNEDDLFSLKSVIYELDLELNPDLYKQERATYISLSDTERIRNGVKPFANY